MPDLPPVFTPPPVAPKRVPYPLPADDVVRLAQDIIDEVVGATTLDEIADIRRRRTTNLQYLTATCRGIALDVSETFAFCRERLGGAA